MANHQNKLLTGALLLTVAGFISKLLSAGYRVPLQNLTGDLGFYIYQQIYPFLGVALMLVLYGFPSAISKLASEDSGRVTKYGFGDFYGPLLLILLVTNGVFALGLFMMAGTIANWMGDVQLERGIRWSALAFLLIPLLALLRGTFQGTLSMKPTAFSQIGEQLVRVGVIVTAAVWITTKHQDAYNIGTWAPFATIAGSVMASMILLIYFVKVWPVTRVSKSIPWAHYVKTILFLGVFSALNHMILLVIQMADAFTLVPGLSEFGMAKLPAMELKGVFDRGQPLIQLGTVIGSSFALALIPSVSQQKHSEQPDASHFYIRSAMKCSLYLAVGATAGLIMIFPEVNQLLFQDDTGTFSLRILSMAILLCSLAITAAAILQGMGYTALTGIFVLVAFVVKWITNQLFVPVWGITGSAIATIFALMILAVLTLGMLRKKVPSLLLWRTWHLKGLSLALIGMGLYVWMMHMLFAWIGVDNRLGLLVYVVWVAVTGALVYAGLLLKTNAFTKAERALLPMVK